MLKYGKKTNKQTNKQTNSWFDTIDRDKQKDKNTYRTYLPIDRYRNLSYGVD